jgi:hypothetical protein
MTDRWGANQRALGSDGSNNNDEKSCNYCDPAQWRQLDNGNNERVH